MIGGCTGNRFSSQAHDDERDEEGSQSIALNLFKLEITNDFTDAPRLHDELKFVLGLVTLTDKTKLGKFVQISYFCIYNSILIFHCKSGLSRFLVGIIFYTHEVLTYFAL